MAPSISAVTSSGRNHEVGFAKLQGEDFEYFMHTYSIILGRDSKKEKVDLDISGGDLTISRHHARIFYDFERKRFSLQVLGKNGCTVEGVLHLPGGSPIKLDSQDLLQIGQKKFYFLLPTRSIFGTSANQRGPSASAAFQPANNGTAADVHNLTASAAAQPSHIGTAATHIGTPAQPGQIGTVTLPPAHIQNNAENENIAGIETQEEFMNHNKMPFGELDKCSSHHITIEPTVALGGQPVNNLAIRTADNNKDNQQEVLLKEEEYVLASIGIVISDLCGLKKMMPIEKLHSELVTCYSATWPRHQVQMHLTLEAGSSAAGTECKQPWLKLMYLLRKYPERFTVMNSSCDEEGQATSVYVTLNSLWP